jgi:hypothetical protein
MLFAWPAQSAPFPGFRTPSSNIYCAYNAPQGAHRATLRCDLLSGLNPAPRRRCELDWTGIALSATGRAAAQCAGDTVADRRLPVLGYGSTWRRGRFTCVSRRPGLTCRNRSGHGFFLSRGAWRVF